MATPPTYTFNFPTTIHFGVGVRHLLADNLKAAGVKRPLIVTDRGLAATPIPSALAAELKAAGLSVGIFSDIYGNPTKSQMRRGVESYKHERADAIVALGGGAAVDVAKAIAVMIHHPGDLFDYEDGKTGALPIDREIPHFVALPTTAGTGSEVGRSTVISDDTTKIKKIIFSPRLLAKAVFADPELTVALPAAITAATGMDAVTHLTEAYLAKGFQPICDGIALEGLKIAAANLKTAVAKGKNLEARGNMLLASMMGAIAFQKGLGVTHSLAHALSTVCDLHHGLANGILIPYTMEFNKKVAADRLKDLARAAGSKKPTAGAFVDWLVRLKRQIGIPRSLKDAGVKPADLERLVQIATADSCHALNPRPTTSEDIRKLFLKAMK